MEIDGETVETVTDFIFLGSKITADGDCGNEIKDTCSWKKSYDQPRQHIEKQTHHFANKGLSSQSYGFSKDPDPGIEPMPYTSPTLQVDFLLLSHQGSLHGAEQL